MARRERNRSEAAEHRTKAQLPDLPRGFPDDGLAHLGPALGALGEDDGHFVNPESFLPGNEVHFDLEGVSIRANTIQVNRFKHLAAEAFEPGRDVLDFQAGDGPRVDPRAVRKDEAGQGPVHDADAADVSGSDDHIGLVLIDGLDESGQVCRIVGQVRVHFADAFIVAFEGIAESGDVGRSKALFPFSAQQMQPVAVIFAEAFHEVAGPVRTGIIDHEDVETSGEAQYLADDVADVIGFVIRGDDYERLRRLHPGRYWRGKGRSGGRGVLILGEGVVLTEESEGMFSQFGRNGNLFGFSRHINRLPVLVEVVIAALAHVHVLLELGTHLVIEGAFDVVGEKFVHLLTTRGHAQSGLECGKKFHRSEQGMIFGLTGDPTFGITMAGSGIWEAPHMRIQQLAQGSTSTV